MTVTANTPHPIDREVDAARTVVLGILSNGPRAYDQIEVPEPFLGEAVHQLLESGEIVREGVVARLAGNLPAEQRIAIESMTTRAMLARWRHAPAGAFTGDYAEHYERVLRARRLADPAGWTAASKSV